MARKKPTEPTDDDGRTDEVIIAENAKIIADAEVAVAKARIVRENDDALERFNSLTRWTPPSTHSRKRTTSPRKRSSTRRSASPSK